MFSATTSQIGDSHLVLYLKSHPLQAFGFAVSIISIILAIIGPHIVPHSPTLGVPGKHLLPPSHEYWFGTDVNGMCIFSRTIAAYRTDLVIAVVGALMALFIGAPLGIIAGYFDGKSGFWGSVSLVILRIMDVIQAFPVFVLGLLLVAAFGPSPQNLIFMIAVANIPGNLRLARSEAISLREKEFVESARAVGNSELRIAFHHILPNAITPVIALLSVVMGFGILLTAGLSFVGAGVRVPTPEWGSMIASGGTTMITGQWWPSFFPGLFMALTIFGFSMLGEIITVLIDPLERIKLSSGNDTQG